MNPPDIPRPPAPVVTRILLVANVAIYILPALTGVVSFSTLGSWFFQSVEAEYMMRRLGAFDERTLLLEPWRLLAATTLHGGVVHLFLNSIALLSIVPRLEEIIGRGRTLFVYFTAAIGGSVMSYFWLGESFRLRVGASGAICGAGAAICIAWVLLRHRYAPGAAVAGAIRLGVLLVNMISLPIVGELFWDLPIDHAAHVGGLLTGGAMAALVVGPLAGLRWLWLVLGVALGVVAYAGPIHGALKGRLTAVDVEQSLEIVEVPELGVKLKLPVAAIPLVDERDDAVDDTTPEESRRQRTSRLPAWQAPGIVVRIVGYQSPISRNTPSLRRRLSSHELVLEKLQADGKLLGWEKVDWVDRVGQRSGGLIVSYLRRWPAGEDVCIVRLVDLPHAAVDLLLFLPNDDVSRELGKQIAESLEPAKGS